MAMSTVVTAGEHVETLVFIGLSVSLFTLVWLHEQRLNERA